MRVEIIKMETSNPQTLLEAKIQDLLVTFFQTYNVKDDDAATIKTLKLVLVGNVLKEFGFDFKYIQNLFKTHTPVHPKNAQKLLTKDDNDEMACMLGQVFVRNERLVRELKKLTGGKEESKKLAVGKEENKKLSGKMMDAILAVDGLAGNISNGPNFDHRLYIGNLKIEDPQYIFDEEPEFKRFHVITVRVMYDMLGDAPSAPQHVYDILRKCFAETVQVELPEIVYEGAGQLGSLEGDLGKMYINTMGKANIADLVKSLRFNRGGEKRSCTEMEAAEENQNDEKR